MRPIWLNDEHRKEIMAAVEKTLMNMPLNSNKFEFSTELADKDSREIHIYYTPEAYAMTVALLMEYQTEVAWHCLVRRLNETDFEVYDVLVYPQIVHSTTVSTDDERYGEWKTDIAINDEEADANMFMQCHSHVNMGVFASQTDKNQQFEEISLKGHEGFYIFQIWNKKLEVTSFVYDLENNAYYEGKEVITRVRIGDNEYADEFAKNSRDMILPDPKAKEDKKAEKEEKKSDKKAEKKKNYKAKAYPGKDEFFEHDYDWPEDEWETYDRYRHPYLSALPDYDDPYAEAMYEKMKGWYNESR